MKNVGVFMHNRQRGRAEVKQSESSVVSLEQKNSGSFKANLAQHESAEASASTSIDSQLQDINKLIFVQEYDLALQNLFELSKRSPHAAEVHFRLVEVGTRVERDHELREHFTQLLQEHPQNLELTLARTLLEIRVEERKQSADDESQLVNPSLRGNAIAEGGFPLPEKASELSQLLPRSYFGLSAVESGRRGHVVGKSVRVARNPLVADDHNPVGIHEQEISNFKREGGVAQDGADGGMDSELIRSLSQEMAKLVLENKDYYAVWYVQGCVAELENNLGQAVEAWTQAYQRNPSSLAVLATLSELQQIGALSSDHETDYSRLFEQLDRFAVHGTYETHSELYYEFLDAGEYRLAIASFRTLADWMQRQKGSVPTEVEILCLLGAMRAHRMEGNSGAAESARREAENLAVSFKKSGENLSGLAFVGQISEEFELPTLARMCYFAVLTNSEAGKDLVVRTAAHCVSQFPSRALSECLSTAYKNHAGDAEIRFCRVLCALAVADVSAKEYLVRKNKIRDLLANEDVGEALGLLQEALAETQEDPEIHYYLAEIYTRLDSDDLALNHYRRMYALDALNAESVMRYVHFLLRLKHYSDAQRVAAELLHLNVLSDQQQGELYWGLSACSFALENREDAGSYIERALQCDPWNLTFLALAMRLHVPSLQADLAREVESLLAQYENLALGVDSKLDEEFCKVWLKKGNMLCQRGYAELSFLMACAVFKDQHSSENVVEFLSQASASFDTRLAAQRLMVMLRETDLKPNFSHLAYCIARMYASSGEWELVEEWSDIALKGGLTDAESKTRLLEIEALKLAVTGQNYSRAQHLLEAAIDGHPAGKKAPPEMGVLHGYLILVQGELKTGVDKMVQHMTKEPSVLSLFFMIKGLARAGQLQEEGSSWLSELFARSPRNSLEQKLIEEIYFVVGSEQPGALVNLTC